MKNKKKVVLPLLGFGLMMGAMPMAALADEVTPVTGGETTFTKYLVLDADAKAPECEFSFSIAAGQAVKGTKTTEAIYAGVGTPTISNVTSSADDVIYTDASNETGLTLAQGEGFTKHEVKIDFSRVSFSHAGVYHYVITEEANDILGVSNDADAKRDMYVYVTSAADGSLSVASYVMMDSDEDRTLDLNAVAKDGDAITGKSYEYTNTYGTGNLTITKEVTGNKADHTKYFKVTVKITDAEPGTKINVVGAGDTFEAAPSANDSTEYDASTMAGGNTVADNVLVVGEGGSVEHTFYLKHGQSVELDGLADGTKWEVVEVEEDYTPNSSVSGDPDAAVNADKNGASDKDSGITADTTVALNDAKKGTIPTGVMTFVGTGAAVTLLAAGGIAAGVISKKKRDEE